MLSSITILPFYSFREIKPSLSVVVHCDTLGNFHSFSSYEATSKEKEEFVLKVLTCEISIVVYVVSWLLASVFYAQAVQLYMIMSKCCSQGLGLYTVVSQKKCFMTSFSRYGMCFFSVVCELWLSYSILSICLLFIEQEPDKCMYISVKALLGFVVALIAKYIYLLFVLINVLLVVMMHGVWLTNTKPTASQTIKNKKKVMSFNAFIFLLLEMSLLKVNVTANICTFIVYVIDYSRWQERG